MSLAASVVTERITSTELESIPPINPSLKGSPPQEGWALAGREGLASLSWRLEPELEYCLGWFEEES